MNAARVLLGVASLTGAFLAAELFHVGRSFFLLMIAAGLVVFAAMMLLLGRDVARRWVAFAATLGFAPVSRRAFFDFGTDRPIVHGLVGRHPARVRYLVTREGREAAAWLQAEVDLFHHDDGTLTRAKAHGARVRDGRLIVRHPFTGFDADDARGFIERVQRVADAVDTR